MAVVEVMPSREGKRKKSALREWWDAVLFAVIVASLFRWLLFEQFSIPTPSMEGTMLVGDVIVVSKLHYGTRTPGTPIQFPLTHQKFWGTEIPSYLGWLQLPMFRLPGLRRVKRMEPVVFNYPYDEGHPTDLKAHWVKRCVGLPGDSLRVVGGDLTVNDSLMRKPPHLQSGYFLATSGTLRQRFFTGHGISEHRKVSGGYMVQADAATADDLREVDFIDEVIALKADYGTGPGGHFPDGAPHGWSPDYFGPLWVPKKGATIVLNKVTIPVYAGIIERFEGWKHVEVSDGRLFAEGRELTDYVFRQNYYFMMGDNRHNSEDSRMWGFVPEDHIVGKPVMVLFSAEEGPWYTLPIRIRWKRLFNLIDE